MIKSLIKLTSVEFIISFILKNIDLKIYIFLNEMVQVSNFIFLK